MRTHPLPPVTAFTQIETHSRSMMSIVINTDCVNTFVSFLITHQVPFSMSAFGTQAESKVTALPQFVSEQPILSKSGEKITGIEFIFQKYIADGLESIPPKIEDIVSETGFSINQFKTLFKNRYGKSFYQLYMEYKMNYSARLLREGYKSIVVSERIGYTHPIKFNKMFQKHFGMTPYKYQKSTSQQ